MRTQIVVQVKCNKPYPKGRKLTKKQQLEVIQIISNKSPPSDLKEASKDIYMFSTDRVYWACSELEAAKIGWEIYDK